MGDSDSTRISTGSISGTHTPTQISDILVAPTTEGEKNLLRAAILPIACFSIQDIHFDFDSSFVLPAIAKEIPHLNALRNQHKDKDTGLFPPFSIFGHADPTGTDEYNKTLSGRRATAIYALLTRNPDLWDNIYNAPLGGDNWQKDALSKMLDALDRPSTEDDVKPLKSDATQRKSLYTDYMNKICPNFQLKPQDFLAQGADGQKGKGDYQGCSDFNPLLVFSQADQDQYTQDTDKTDRDAANAVNRRVMIFLFPPGAKIDPTRWPCPRASEGDTGCINRFWSDGNKRRHTRLPDDPRKYEDTQDTFACRFYDRLANGSNCEQIVLVCLLTLRIMDGDDNPYKGAPYTLDVFNSPPSTSADGSSASSDSSSSSNGSTSSDSSSQPLESLNGTTNDSGILQQLIPASATFGHLSLFPPPSSGSQSGSQSGDQSANNTKTPIWTIDLNIEAPVEPTTIAGVQARLNNLGMFASETVDETQTGPVPDLTQTPDAPNSASAAPNDLNLLRRAIQRFQRLYKPHGDADLTPTGQYDDDTKKKIEEKYGS